MKDLVLLIVWYLFHLFCSGWIHDWVDARAGISSDERKAYIDQQEAEACKGKSKLEIWFGETLPSSREIRRWSEAHAADPVMYKRCLWISRLSELPAVVFVLWCFLASREFLGVGSVPSIAYAAIVVYDLIFLILGIRWRRRTL